MINTFIGLFAGFLGSFAFEPFAIWPLAIISLGIWYQFISRQTLKQRLRVSYFFGLGILLPTQVWTGIYVGNLPWLMLCFMQALFFLIPSFFVGKNKRLNPVAFVCSYILVELTLRTVPFTGFGWTRLGFTQTDSLFRGIYPLLGVAAVTGTLAWISTIRNLRSLIITTLTISLVYLIPNPVDLNGSIKIALIQGGVVNLGLDFNDKPKEVFIRHVNQTQKSVTENQVDLIVWPENAVDVDVFKNKDVMESITELSKNLSTPILVGGVTNSPNPRNQSMLFAPNFTQVYTKRYLTPFGEYLPLRELAEKVSPYADQVNDFDAGSNPVVFQVDDYKFRSLICYELLDDRFVIENNQNFLLIQTNNATFGDTAQLDQQLTIAKVRAAESSRHIAYVSTTGITSFINHKGKVESKLDKFTAGTLISEMEISNGATYAQRFGWMVEPLAIIALLILLIVRRWGRQ